VATELTMPQMGYDMQEGTVVRWLKTEGSPVQMGEAVAEIETDKAVVEFESYGEGILLQILVAEGTTVPVGETIAIVGAESEVPVASTPDEPTPAVEASLRCRPRSRWTLQLSRCPQTAEWLLKTWPSLPLKAGYSPPLPPERSQRNRPSISSRSKEQAHEAESQRTTC